MEQVVVDKESVARLLKVLKDISEEAERSLAQETPDIAKCLSLVKAFNVYAPMLEAKIGNVG